MAITFLTNEDKNVIDEQIGKLSEEIDDLSKEMENVGNPTDEQVSAAVNAYLEENPVEATPANKIVAEAADKIVPKFEVSGKTVKFETIEGAPVKVTTALPFYQEGEGVPSPDNVRPIRLYDSVKLTNGGLNLFGGIDFANTMANDTRSNINTEAHTVVFNPSNCPRGVIYDRFEEGKQYTFILRANAATSAPHLNLRINYTDGTLHEPRPSATNVVEDVVYTTPAGKSVANLSTVWFGGYVTFEYEHCGVFEGAFAKEDFESYTGNETYTALIHEPVVDGTLNWSGGTATTDKMYQRLDQLSGWTVYRTEDSRVTFRATLTNKPDAQRIITCSHFIDNGITTGDNSFLEGCWLVSTLDGIFVDVALSRGITTVEQWTAWLAAEADKGTPVTVVMTRNAATIPCDTPEIIGKPYMNIMTTSDGDITVTGSVNLANKLSEFKFKSDEWGLPVLALKGDISPIAISKDNKVTLSYDYEGRSGTCTLKGQGSSSYAIAQGLGKRGKYNFTINFDKPFEAKNGWGKQKKYCLKANFIDFSQSRNVVSATLWGQMVKRRAATTPTYEEVFDLNAVTGWKSAKGVEYPNAFTIADGVLTSNTCSYQTAELVMWLGQQYRAGYYVLALDYYCKGIADGFARESFGYGIVDDEDATGAFESGYQKEYVINTFGEWKHVELPLYYTKAMNGYFMLNGIFQTGMQFKNISLKKKSFEMRDLPNGGAIDGFPIIITINGEFQGLYTFNIPKDGWMMGMGEGEHEAILCADYSPASWFQGDATLDGDFDVEYAPDEDDTEWIKTSVNRLINACKNSDGTDLDTTVAQYLDWESAIDYLLLKKFLNGVDMGGKNYILATYDGVKWYFSAYDMDCVFGLDWDGKRFYSANTGVEFSENSQMTVDRLIMTYKKDALKARYAALRGSVFSDDNIATTFTNFIGAIPSTVYAEDAKRWSAIPNTSANNLHQIVDFFCRRAAILDKTIQQL